MTSQTGYPSIDKPWLKYYSEEAINYDFSNQNIYDTLFSSNKDNLSDIAIEYCGTHISYKVLFDQIERVEKSLRAFGVKEGDIVTLSMVTTPELIYLFYALSKIGAIANIIDPRLGKDEVTRTIIDTNSKVVVSIDLVASYINQILKDFNVSIIAVSVGGFFSKIHNIFYGLSHTLKSEKRIIKWNDFLSKSMDTDRKHVKIDSNMPVLMTHTSGTTGKPKMVMLSHNNVNAVTVQYKLGMTYKRQQKYMAVIPPFIAFGICVAVHLPLCLGMICIPIPKFEVKKFYSYLKKYNPNHFTCTPSNLEYLSNDKRKIDLSNLIVPSVGGDYIGWKKEEKINSYLRMHGCKYELVKGYGMTEVSSSACTTKNGFNKPGSVGFPLVKMIISIFEPQTENELKYNQEGEICFTGPNVMIGYYNNQEATKMVLRRHKDGNIWVHSGDIGYMDEDGFLYVIDRIKRLIHLSNGYKLLPSKIERCILNLDEVEACAVIGHQYNIDYKARAYVIRKTNVTESEIMSYCKKQLPSEIIPEDIVFIEKLPLTPVGKIDYKKLEDIDHQR